MLTELRLVHTSDLHLGGDGRRSEIRHGPLCLCPLRAVSAEVASAKATILIVAGDLFDHGRVDRGLVRRVALQLGAMGVWTVILPGNHDPAGAAGPYSGSAWLGSRGVTVLTDPAGHYVRMTPSLAVWGRPIVDHSPRTRPLAGVPPRGSERWRVVVAHGHYVDDGEANHSHRSSQILASELAAAEADYVALGHWDVSREIRARHPVTWYSGAVEVADRRGSVLLVDFDAGGVHVQARRLRSAPAECPDDGESPIC